MLSKKILNNVQDCLKWRSFTSDGNKTIHFCWFAFMLQDFVLIYGLSCSVGDTGVNIWC